MNTSKILYDSATITKEVFSAPAFEVKNEAAEFPCLLVCEHASNYIPPTYMNLGLSTTDIETHIGWDIGARALLDHLSTNLKCSTVSCNYSRLLIDCNRPLDAASLIPDVSEHYTVPGNSDISHQEHQLRINSIYKPFHAAVESQVLRLKDLHPQLPVIGIHSFTPVFHGEKRPWEFSLMWKQKSPFIRALIEYFQNHEIKDVVGYNEPYSVEAIRAYTTEHYTDVHKLPAAIFEVRQDLLGDQEGIERWSSIIQTALRYALRSVGVGSTQFNQAQEHVD